MTKSIKKFTTELFGELNTKKFQFDHYPVLHNEILAAIEKNLDTKNPLMLDCTLGAGNHSLKFLTKYPYSSLIGNDLDVEMIELSKNKYAKESISPERFHFLNENFSSLNKTFFQTNKLPYLFDCILLDPGLNSIQVDNPAKGFSYSNDSPLIMRYSREPGTFTAEFIINEYSELELTDLFERYGEINRGVAEKISKEISKHKTNERIGSSQALKKIILSSCNEGEEKKFKLLSQVFQALRIVVNDEITNLQLFMQNAFELLDSKGILFVLTFHSLERKVIANELEKIKKTNKNLYKNIYHDLRPTIKELDENPRSRSSSLYAIQKKQKKIEIAQAYYSIMEKSRKCL